jgi:hypothetical protein
MSTHDWLPDNREPGAGKEPTTPYVLVPQLRLAANVPLGRLNMAGWADKDGDSYACTTCKKQLRLSLTELLIFPLVKAGTDLFQFSYVVPQHKVGGAFSNEICKESGTKVLRDHEYPTSIRFMNGDQAPTDRPDEQEASAEGAGPVSATAHEDMDKEEVKKKVDVLSPKMAEERYDYLLSRPISDLTDAEYAERLALVERLTGKPRKSEQK